MNKSFLVAVLGGFLALLGSCARTGNQAAGQQSAGVQLEAGLSAAYARLGDGLFARINTVRGDIIVSLEFERTPLTVINFVALAEGTMDAAEGAPFYDGLVFHRVISIANGNDQDFMIQTGCPQGTGTGGPGYTFPDEIVPELRHDGIGVLSMANAGPGTNGSQFFITILPTPWLDGNHTVFGRVVEGQSIVNSTRQGDRINTIRIIRNGPAANAFQADQAAFDATLAQITAAATERAREQREADIAQIQEMHPNATLTASGVRYIIEQAGTGIKPATGQMVQINYVATLLSGEVFDDTSMRGRPSEFQAGIGRVIRGWDEMVMDMRVGERRVAVIPPELAFGERGEGSLIPPNSFIVIDMELVGVR